MCAFHCIKTHHQHQQALFAVSCLMSHFDTNKNGVKSSVGFLTALVIASVPQINWLRPDFSGIFKKYVGDILPFDAY